MRKPLTDRIAHQTDLTLYNIQVALSTCRFEEELNEVPVWRILYSALYEFDCRFPEPGFLCREPEFHTAGMEDLNLPYSGKPLTKDQLVEYYLDVKARIFLYLDEMDDDLLLQKPKNCPYTRLDLILDQLRRFTYQIGRVNAFTELLLRKRPVFIGIEEDYPKDHQYFEEPHRN